MNSNIINSRNIGINFHENALPTIKVWAPYAHSVELVLLNKESYPLEKAEFGFWQANCPKAMPGDKYFLKLNGKNRLPDPASLAQTDGVNEASECIDLNEIRKIRAESWEGISPKKHIIYELHVGTFTPEGTFEAIISKLTYLKELGINAVEIMPVGQFPGNRNWGYDGVFPFAVQNSYGGAKEFAKLIKACHENGIALILDVVYNHLGPEGNTLANFGPYFSGNYITPWGKAINFDDAWCDGVRNFFLENALMWLRDFHVDGLRIDAVHTIKDMSPVHFLQELNQNVLKLNENTGNNHFLIAESDLNDTKIINSLGDNGYGFDAQWCDDFHHALHALITGDRMSYYNDFGSVKHLVKAYNNAYVYDGNYSEFRKKFFGTATENLKGEKFIVYAQNHDQTGNRMLGERLSSLVDFETLKLSAAAVFVSPFVPMFFMGEEYGEENPFLYFISLTNESLLKRIVSGRKRDFGDFQNKKNKMPNPQSEKTYNNSKLSWSFQDSNQKQILLEYYKMLIQLRKTNELINADDRSDAIARESRYGNAIVFSRSKGNKYLLVFMNFYDRPIEEHLPELNNKNPDLLFYSAHTKWGGSVQDSENPLSYINSNLAFIKINPRSVAVFFTNID